MLLLLFSAFVSSEFLCVFVVIIGLARSPSKPEIALHNVHQQCQSFDGSFDNLYQLLYDRDISDVICYLQKAQFHFRIVIVNDTVYCTLLAEQFS